jgi:hypothetical protein
LKLILVDAEDDDDEFDDIVCSSKCVFLCNFKWTSCVKRAEHKLFGHKYGLSPVCKRRWVFKFDVDENLFGQYGHEWGRSPFKINKNIKKKTINFSFVIYLNEQVYVFEDEQIV